MSTSLNQRQIMRELRIFPKNSMKDKSEWYRIRKAVKSPELYMQADGKWGPWKAAKRFRTQDEAYRFAEFHTKDGYGLFNYEN